MTQTNKFNGTFNGTVTPMFAPKTMEQPMSDNKSNKTQNNAPQTQTELSVFDVKELYDLAYSYKADDNAKFKAVLAEAVKLDMAYRRQIEKKMPYAAQSAKSEEIKDKTKVA